MILTPEEIEKIWKPSKNWQGNGQAVAQAQLRKVIECLLKHQIVTQRNGLLIYIPAEDWQSLRREAGLEE